MYACEGNVNPKLGHWLPLSSNRLRALSLARFHCFAGLEVSSPTIECQNGDPLEEDKLIQVDGDNQRFGQGMAVRLAGEDPPLRRKDDARKLLEIGDVVCGAKIRRLVSLLRAFLAEGLF